MAGNPPISYSPRQYTTENPGSFISGPADSSVFLGVREDYSLQVAFRQLTGDSTFGRPPSFGLNKEAIQSLKAKLLNNQIGADPFSEEPNLTSARSEAGAYWGFDKGQVDLGYATQDSVEGAEGQEFQVINLYTRPQVEGANGQLYFLGSAVVPSTKIPYDPENYTVARISELEQTSIDGLNAVINPKAQRNAEQSGYVKAPEFKSPHETSTFDREALFYDLGKANRPSE